ncbi:MAG: hypothetical protein K0Q72_3392 [Armatimonadetes bacterium]|jgi:ribosomal protein S18 acetylase RimI-like enzyme|nr:hypothetical protein [Armatimonadota bacterium]
MSLRLRAATEDDAQRLWEVRAAAIHQRAGEHYSQEQLDAWAARRTPPSYQAPIARGRIQVALEDETTVGFVQLDLQAGEIEAIYVHPGWTRRGVGNRLLAEAQERAAAAGLTRLVLDASLNAVQFYEQAGSRSEREVRYPLGNGDDFTCVFMTKSLL